ncbi:MAG: GNAT family N-acetyltransferase [Bryobacteraceae bacterium]|nr:GNAT family N-acetyltransferase [Bryobacteraceae bacterium]
MPLRAHLDIRPALEADEPFLWDMLYLALFVPPGQPPIPRAVLLQPAISRYVRDWGRRAGDSGVIAVLNGLPVGAAWLRLFSAADPGYGFVDETTPELTVAVLPDHRGQGTGTLLLTSLLRTGPSACLSCDPANPAYRLYLRLGFRPLAGSRTMIWNS